MDNFLKDLAYGVRTLRKSPGFTVTALITLALGIGASTAIFSVVDAVLLRPLPYADAGGLVIVNSEMRNRKVKDFPIAPGDIPDLRQGVPALSSIAALVTFRAPLVEDGAEAEQVRDAVVTGNLLPMLGARFALGRNFTDDEAAPPPPQGPAAPNVNAPAPPPLDVAVVLTHEFWRRRFGGDPNILGRSFRLAGNNAHVVGVLAPGFELLFPPRFQVERHPDVLQIARNNFAAGSRINVVFRLVGRLKPGATVAEAQAQLDAVGADLRQRFPIKQTAGFYFQAVPMRAELAADVRPALLALMGAVAFVLLIACANVANLILVRTSRRERELAVRAAFGGSRARLVRQMLAEALVLAAGGAVLGLLVARLGIAALTAVGPQSLPHIGDVGLDAVVLGFTVFATLAAAALFGVVPALRASRPDLMDVLRQGGRTGGLAAGGLLRSGVVTAEVTLAFVLLIGGGLMFRSFLAIAAADPGFDPAGVLTFSVANANARTPESRAAFQRAMHERLAALPGVTAVSAVFPIPLDGTMVNSRWGLEDAVADASHFKQANAHIVEPGYFAAMRTAILAGRDFDASDNVPASEDVIVDSLFAAQVWPGQPAVGKRIYVRFRADTAEWMNVIGVVRHQRHETLAADGRYAVFFADGQLGYGAASKWLVRTNGDPNALVAPVRAAVAVIDPQVPVAEMQPLEQYVSQARASTRFALILIGSFAVIAVVLSGVGLYGVLSTMVRQRTAEIGVRMALGAPASGIFRLVIGQGMRLSLAGIGVGLAAALLLTRVMRSMLVGVAATDPATYAAVALLFAAIAAVSCWLPARRAASLDPAVALRDE
ncbi:MAG TPA: ABC transporter permease [Gemmatimonadaceae bacterium]|nr:ABC transporter permease [Gemmatimonadaceae bacterium]